MAADHHTIRSFMHMKDYGTERGDAGVLGTSCVKHVYPPYTATLFSIVKFMM